jgi:ferredoxin/flavodoxin---NADP+ reductase
MNNNANHLVAVVGAGPAGLFAARELASQGVFVILLNRDIKPGGLAEYGIYPNKHKMKDGLRNQFYPVVCGTENIRYYGNVLVGDEGDLSLCDLKDLGVQAALITTGAQGTKWLGLEGENLKGVYHAKDIVYHYNRLPPFSQHCFQIGKRVAVIGMGNVMTDITYWLTSVMKVDEVMAIARRGPGEVKFDKKEMERIAANLDYPALDMEIDRVTPILRAISQDPEIPRHLIHSAQDKAIPTGSSTRFTLHFLASPTRILGDEQGNVAGLEVEDNTLTLAQPGGEVKARSLDSHRVFPVDTVIFAIGDRVDEHLGLPIQGGEYQKNNAPRFPLEGQSYEIAQVDPCLENVFVAGWSRKASTGLVGVARKDGINGARAILEYLETLPVMEDLYLERIGQRLQQLNHPVVTGEDIQRLLAAEEAQGRELGVDHFKLATNAEMLEAMGLREKSYNPRQE